MLFHLQLNLNMLTPKLFKNCECMMHVIEITHIYEIGFG